MIPRVTRSGLPYQEDKLKKVIELAEEDNLDYYNIVSNVESIL